MPETLEVTPQEVRLRLADNPELPLIDVREPEEFAIAKIAGAQLIPMQAVPGEFQRLEKLADEQNIIVICHHGVRSLQVVSWLRAHGIENCFSLNGGIDRWSREIDPAVPRY